MITINLKLFSLVRYTLGISKLKLKVKDGTTAKDVIYDIKLKNWEKLGGIPIRLAVNQSYVKDDFILHDSDEIALIPPVSGG